MRNVSFGLLLFVVLFSGCKKDRVRPECAGSSTYYIRNQSDHTLSVAFLTTPQLGSKTDSTHVVAVGQATKIADDAMFGYIPKPTDTFVTLTLSRETDGKKVVVYRQNPVHNEAWVKQKQNPNDPDFGCYAVSYTLTVTNGDLQ